MVYDGGRGISLTYCTGRAYELRIVRGIVRWAELSFAGPAPFPPRGGHAAGSLRATSLPMLKLHDRAIARSCNLIVRSRDHI